MEETEQFGSESFRACMAMNREGARPCHNWPNSSNRLLRLPSVLAVGEILSEYRKFIAYGANL